MPDLLRWLNLGCVALLIGACAGEPESGAVAVKWDRDACERCRMVLSDRMFPAQVRVFPDGGRPRVFKFDDIGCAVLWLDKESWNTDPRTEIWVVDHLNGEWIDARTAVYLSGLMSPMQYGLGAQSDPHPQGLSFEQARQQIYAVEARFGLHGVQLQKRRAEQAGHRDVVPAEHRDSRHPPRQ